MRPSTFHRVSFSLAIFCVSEMSGVDRYHGPLLSGVRSDVAMQRERSSRGLIPFRLIGAVAVAADLIVIFGCALASTILYHDLILDLPAPIDPFVTLGVFVFANFAAIQAGRGNYQPQQLFEAPQADSRRFGHLAVDLRLRAGGSVFVQADGDLFARRHADVLRRRLGWPRCGSPRTLAIPAQHAEPVGVRETAGPGDHRPLAAQCLGDRAQSRTLRLLAAEIHRDQSR